MQSNIIVEDCHFTHLPATMTFIGDDLFYKIEDVSDRFLKGFSFVSGSGTNNPLGKFVLLRGKRMAITVPPKKVYPYS